MPSSLDISSCALDDLTVPAEKILKFSPEVEKVEVLLSPFRPTHRIIHIADMHFFSREWYRSVRDPPSEEGYSEYIRQVETIQRSQYRLLVGLADEHRLRQVFDEGIDQEFLPCYRELIERGRQATPLWGELMSCLTELSRQIDESEANGQDATGLRVQKAQLEKRHYATRRAGAVGQLLFARPSVELLATEDKIAYDNAGRAMRIALDSHRSDLFVKANGPREEAIVRNLLDHGGCSVIVLGGAHDLSRQIKRMSDGRCEYVKVFVKGYPRSTRPSFLYRDTRQTRAQSAARANERRTERRADPQSHMAFAVLLILLFGLAGRTRPPTDSETHLTPCDRALSAANSDADCVVCQ